jgi:hypothetical protein
MKPATMLMRRAALNRDVGPQCGKGFLEARLRRWRVPAPSFTSVRRTGKWECSTSWMIAS